MKKWKLVEGSVLIMSCVSFTANASNNAAGNSLFQTVVNDQTISINSTIPNKCYNSAGIKSSSSLTTFPSLKECGTPKGYCLFKVCNDNPTNVSYSGPAGNVDFSICLNGQGNTSSCETVPITTQYAYVADSGNKANQGNIWQCPINSSGSLGTCVIVKPTNTEMGYTPWGGPLKIAFAKVGKAEYAYIANGNGNNAPNAIYTCSLNVRNDRFNTCVISNEFGDASQVAFATLSGKKYAYVADYGNPSTGANPYVWKCNVSATDGSLFACKQQVGVWSRPSGVTLKKINNNYYAYVSDYGATQAEAAVRKCSINTANGAFTSCSLISRPNAGWRPWEVTFHSIGNNEYAYIADSGFPQPINSDGTMNGKVWQCRVASNGALNNCVTLTPKFVPSTPSYGEPFGIAFTKVKGVTYAYVADGGARNFNAQVYQCLVNSTGTFNQCMVLPHATKWRPDGITILSRS